MRCTPRHPDKRGGLCPDCGYDVLPVGRLTFRGWLRFVLRPLLRRIFGCWVVGHKDRREEGVLGCARCFSRKVFNRPLSMAERHLRAATR